MSVLDSGWFVANQIKSYGKYIKIALSEGSGFSPVELEVLEDNPLGLRLNRLPPIQATRAAADKLGFALAALFDVVEPSAARASIAPPPSLVNDDP